jgi:hypothetical protein
MTKNQALKKATEFVKDLPEGTEVVVVFQLPGENAQIVSSLDSDRELADALRSVAHNLSPAGDA